MWCLECLNITETSINEDDTARFVMWADIGISETVSMSIRYSRKTIPFVMRKLRFF